MPGVRKTLNWRACNRIQLILPLSFSQPQRVPMVLGESLRSAQQPNQKVVRFDKQGRFRSFHSYRAQGGKRDGNSSTSHAINASLLLRLLLQRRWAGVGVSIQGVLQHGANSGGSSVQLVGCSQWVLLQYVVFDVVELAGAV
jgi:hypothetical protein